MHNKDEQQFYSGTERQGVGNRDQGVGATTGGGGVRGEGWNNGEGVGLQELGAESKGFRVVMGEGYKANESKSFQKPTSMNNERMSYVIILESRTNL